MSRNPNIEKGFGVAMSLSDWHTSRYNVHHLTRTAIKERIRRGYTIEQALTIPLRARKGCGYSDEVVRQMLRQKYLTFKQIARMAARSYEAISRMMGG